MKFVIFHGAYGSKDGNWFLDLKNNLLSIHQEVIHEQFPVENWDEVIKSGKSFKGTKQNLENWLKYFESNILPHIKKDDRLCFIGHSLGPVFILHLLERYNLQLDSAIFVMPFLVALKKESSWMFDAVNNTFYKSDFDFAKLKKVIPVSYTLYSDNDPFVNPALALDFAQKLESSTIVIRGGKHINAPLFTKLPLVYELCKTRLNPEEYIM